MSKEVINTPAAILSRAANIAAVNAAKQGESFADSKYRQTIDLAALLCLRQADNILNNVEVSKKSSQDAWTAFLIGFAFRGNQVWRVPVETGASPEATKIANDANAILASKLNAIRNNKSRDAKVKLCRDYIEKKPKNARLVDGLANVKTWFGRVVKDVTTNHVGIIRTVVELARTESVQDSAVYDRTIAELDSIYGGSWNALVECFPKEARASDTDKVEAFFVKAQELDMNDLERLVQKLQNYYAERLGNEADAIGDGESEESDEGAFEAEAA